MFTPGAHPFPGVRTGPADAELFIVPVFCSASLVAWSQRNATRLGRADLSEAAQLQLVWADMVTQLEYLKPGVANHVLVCPHWMADTTFRMADYPRPPPELLVGTYAAPNGLVGTGAGSWPEFVVGQSTYAGMQGLAEGKRRAAGGAHSLSPVPAAGRKYNVSFIGRWDSEYPGEPGTYKKTDTDWAMWPVRCAPSARGSGTGLTQKRSLTRVFHPQGWPDWPGELYRRSFKDFVVRTRAFMPPDFYLPLGTAHQNSFVNQQADPFAAWAATEAIMANSVVCLSLPGDQFVTDRIVNAFEAGCIIAALDVEKERLFRQLPFHFAVPWDDLILWIPTESWLVDPIATLRKAMDGLSTKAADARLRMTERHRPDITWSSLDSRATHNVLVAARSTADGTAAKFPACAHRVRCAPPNSDEAGCFACAPVATA